jgi:DNA invertase Pin-like site-specific DNA recombinase
VTDRNNERPGPNEALATFRAGDTLVATKPDRFALPLPMLENIVEVMTRLSQEFRQSAGMTMTI